MMRGGALAVVFVLALAGCASAPTDPDAPKDVSGQNIAPYEVHQECRNLVAGDRLDYRFTSSSPVSFNIHYHEINAVVIPLSREGVTADSGIFQPTAPHEFCLTWEAGGVPVVVSYRVGVRHRRPS